MKNGECYKILRGLDEVRQVPYSEISSLLTEEKMKYLFHTDFVLACARNKKAITEHLQILEEMKKPGKEFTSYQEERIELAKKHSKKDVKGHPVLMNQKMPDGTFQESFVIDDVKDVDSPFNCEFRALKEKYKATLEDQQCKEKQYVDALDAECDLKLVKIVQSKLPAGLSVTAMEAILYFLEDEPVNKEVK